MDRPPVILLDACVLYPAAQRDLFMWLAAGGVVRAHWTNRIHQEWIQNVARDYRVSRQVLERVRTLMDRAVGDALVGAYRGNERFFPKTDAKDRHVAAAALAARKRSGADEATIVTWNIRDFHPKELAAVGLAAEDPDAFLCRLFASSPEAVSDAFTRMSDNLRHPPRTIAECIETLAAQGLKEFALAMRAWMGEHE